MGLHQVWILPIGLLLTRHKVLEEEMSAADKKRNDSWIPCIILKDLNSRQPLCLVTGRIGRELWNRFPDFQVLNTNADLIVMSLLIASRAVILELSVAVLQPMN